MNPPPVTTKRTWVTPRIEPLTVSSTKAGYGSFVLERTSAGCTADNPNGASSCTTGS